MISLFWSTFVLVVRLHVVIVNSLLENVSFEVLCLQFYIHIPPTENTTIGPDGSCVSNLVTQRDT